MGAACGELFGFACLRAIHPIPVNARCPSVTTGTHPPDPWDESVVRLPSAVGLVVRWHALARRVVRWVCASCSVWTLYAAGLTTWWVY